MGIQRFCEIDDDKKNQYLKALEKHTNEKPISRKTMEFGLKLTNHLPTWVTDRILTIYLNKIRTSR